MLRIVTLIISFLLLSSCAPSDELSSRNFYKSVTFLNQKNDDLTIQQVFELYKNGDFNIPMENKIFFKLKGKEASWLHFKINPSKKDHFLSIWNPFLENSQVYLSSGNDINTLRLFSLTNKNEEKWNYHFPNWKIPKNNELTDVFIRVIDSKNKSGLKLMLQSSDEFIQYTQTDYTVIAIQSSFMLISLLIVILLFSSQKKFSIIFYGAYIFILALEYLVHRGLDLQYGYTFGPVFHSSKRVFLQCFGLIFALIFFIKFYPFDKYTQKIKTLFKIIVLTSVFLNTILFVQYLVQDVFVSKILIWNILRTFALLVLISHLYLISKKILPWYLGVAFSLPIIGFFTHALSNPRQDMYMWQNFAIDNLFQITITLEILLILFYIISQLVKSEFLAITLQNENLELRSDFQDNILKAQQQERNKLVSNVHDSFGGYLEALKLRLLQKAENTPEKIQEILDAFYKEYRYLLNSLHSPKINSENFVENLIEFCEKLNKLTDNSILHHFSLEESKLSQEKCVHLYSVISELTTNAIKYSKASEIKIEISQLNKDQITLMVSDNGIGFDKNLISKNGFGLNNIKTRVEQMNGNLEINSNKNSGTTIIIQVPQND